MKITEFSQGQFVILQLEGDITMFNVSQLKKKGEEVISDGLRLAIDLEKADHIDSSGMGVLVRLQDLLLARELPLVLLKPNEKIMEIFRLIHIDRIFKILYSYDELP